MGYQRPLSRLATRSNADLIATVLSGVGFNPVVRYDLKVGGMGKELKMFIDSVQPGDFVFIYFSGYGAQLGQANYLLPVDFDPDDDLAPGQKAIGISYILDQLEDRHA